jgi:hypothetical protein
LKKCRTEEPELKHKMKAPRKFPGRSALPIDRGLVRQPWPRPPAASLCRCR